MINPDAKKLRDEIVARADALVAGWPPVEPPSPLPTLTIHGAAVTEGQSAMCRITSPIPFAGNERIFVSTYTPGAVDAGEATDFEPLDNLLVVPVPGSTEAAFSLHTVDDALVEAEEYVGVRIVRAERVIQRDPDDEIIDLPIDGAEALVTIIDNDVAPPPTGTPPNLMANPAALQPVLLDGIFFVPRPWTDLKTGNVVEKDGQITLYLTAQDKYEADVLKMPVTVRYFLDGKSVGTAVADPAISIPGPDGHWKYLAPLKIARPADGMHDLHIRLLGQPKSQMRAKSASFSIGVAPQELGSYDIAVHGHTASSSHYGRAPYDKIKWPGGRTRPKVKGKPRGIPLLPGLTPAEWTGGVTPIGRFCIEPFLQHIDGLYMIFSDLRQDARGWIKSAVSAWQAGTHSAPPAAIAERRKPEYDGLRLQGIIDGYSATDYGVYVEWGISLRGGLWRIDLRTGEKQPIAGRIYRDETIALDHADPTITQAQIDAANYELVGDAASPKLLDWNTPHSVYADPSDPDNKCIVLDSLGHQVVAVDANFSPAKVTLLVGGNGPGRVSGPLAQAKINRPYAGVWRKDGRIQLCCTPPAGQEQDSCIVEIDAARTALREIIGPDKTTRPFWICEHADPDCVVYWELVGGGIHRLNTVTGEIERNWAKTVVGKNPITGEPVIGPFVNARPDGWGQVVCDVNGTISKSGPGTIYFLTSQSTANTSIWVFDPKTGMLLGEFLKTSIGVARQGPAETAFDLPMHYPWYLAIHKLFGLFTGQGFGNLAPICGRLKQPTDVKVTYEHGAYSLGQSMFWGGSLPGVPCDLRPAGRGLRGASGDSIIGLIPSLRTLLDEMTDDQLMEYFRAGGGGSHERPEWVGAFAQQILYWFRWQQDDLRPGLAPPKIIKKPAPVITGWSAVRGTEGVTVSLTTDKPVWVCLTDLNGSEAGRVATSHSLFLPDAWDFVQVLIGNPEDGQMYLSEAVRV